MDQHLPEPGSPGSAGGGEADGAPSTVARGRRPGVAWTTVGRGLHTREPSPAGRLRAWSQILRPGAAFTHLTGAAVRGWWLPPLPDELPVWVVQHKAQHASTRPGLIAIRQRGIPPSELVDGLRVATPAEILVTCARDLGLLDLVVLADAALHVGDVTLDELRAVAREHRRGAPALRRALPLADGRSESAWETLLRMLHVVCGIDVEPQKELWANGGFVARADLWLVGTRTIHEYDGVDHRGPAQQRKDLKRDRRLTKAGIERRGYTAVEVVAQPLSILRDADAAVGRPHDPQRIQAWYSLLRESLFTPAGTARLRSRLGLDEETDELGA